MEKDILEVFTKELVLISDMDIKTGVTKLFKQYEERLFTQPSSLSGRFHPRDKDIISHLRRTVWFAKELAREFNIVGEDFDILIAACLLHDFGMFEISRPGKVTGGNWKYYPETDYSLNMDGTMELHPIHSSIIIGRKPFKCSRRIQDLVEVHMEHWYDKSCRLPKDILEYCICVADYFASKNVVIKDTEE